VTGGAGVNGPGSDGARPFEEGSAGTSLPGSDGETLSSAEQVPGTALVVEVEVPSDVGSEMLSVDKLGGDDMVEGERWVGDGGYRGTGRES
jgi:hypothetical protein